MDKISGYLEVGTNDQGEVVINHPDLKPDENGVGHIIFSPQQARDLARSLRQQADNAEVETLRKYEKARHEAAAKIPVDRSARTLTDGSPVPADDSHTEINPETGMQKGYVVLSAEERAKGFIRPVRRTYRHVGAPRPKYPLKDLDERQKRLYEGAGYVKYEEYPEEKHPSLGRFYAQAQLDRIEAGCGAVTTMSTPLAETYAREPRFYSGTYCATCRTHFPVGADGEFVWMDGTRVGT